MASRSRSPTPTSSASSPGRSNEPVAGPSSSAATSPEDERGRTGRPSSPSETIPDDSQDASAAAADGKKKRTRTLTTPYQSAVLHALLAQSRFPTTQMREDVGRAIGLSARKVQIWFQNQRQKAKRAAQSQQAAPPTPAPPQYGPYTHAQAASSTASTSTTTATGLALDPGLGGAVAGLMFSSSGGLFGGPRQPPKAPILPPLPENAQASSSHGHGAGPSTSIGAPGLPTRPGPYRSASRSHSLSRSASRLSVSTTSSWSRPPSDWAASEFDLAPPTRPFDEADRRSIASAPGTAYSTSSFPSAGQLGRHSGGPLPGAAGSASNRASAELAALNLGRSDSPFAYPPPSSASASSSAGAGIELPPLSSPLVATASRTSLPPPFTLEPAPVWDARTANPFAARPGQGSSRFSASSSIPRSLSSTVASGGNSGELGGGNGGDPREPLPYVRTELFARAPARWDPVRAAAAEQDRAEHDEAAMDVDADEERSGPASAPLPLSREARQPPLLPGRASRTP